jgi:hypothetical protein
MRADLIASYATAHCNIHTQLPELGSPHLSSGGGKATKRLQPL